MDPQLEQIKLALIRDRFRLSRQWQSIQRGRTQPASGADDRQVRKFQAALDASRAEADRRRAAAPRVTFDQELPILAHREEIIAAVTAHPVVVVCGETGSGKSTQLPKLCLASGFGVTGLIGHTQPRRIAARTIAQRVAEELGSGLGNEVGFKIRFSDKTNPRTYIKLMTDGILLAETQGDRFLEQYEVLIIDEAHERSLNIDFLLGYVKRLLPKRPDLRVIITSATIDAGRFSEHYELSGGPAPVIQVSGRSYPVETRYRPWDVELADADADPDSQQLVSLLAAVHELAAIDRGDMLVFLPTERDIREVAKRLRAERLPGDGPRKTEILPLYARLSAAEQNRVFRAHTYRRIILATNVAESSLTVPGIRFVIDTGTARISRYAPRSKVQRLPIEAISQASSNQRKGRCGRIGPGICIRLYSEGDFEARPPYTTPEIQRTNLASVILQALSLRLGRVDQFPLLDPPREDAIRDGYRTLFEIGAVDGRREITELGRRLSRLPVDPRIGRIILAGDEESCLSDVLIIAAALELQDPRERPHDKQQQADQAHRQFADQQSDFLSFLKIWDFYHRLKENLSHRQLRRACLQSFLSYNRMREWSEIHRQLQKLAASNGLRVSKRASDTDDLGDYAAIHRSLLTGYLSGVANKTGDYEYTGAGGVKFHFWPGSGLFQTKPSWCVAAELVETTRRYGRIVARINPAWVEPLAGHLVKRHYSEPHFHKRSGTVMAYERVTLYGLAIVPRRRTHYGSVDPQLAREVFIREGLAMRQLESNDSFYLHNEQLLDDLTKQAAKIRKGQYLVDEYTLRDFYETRIPRDVVGLPGLRKWLRQPRGGKSPNPLHMCEADLVAVELHGHLEEDDQDHGFPAELEVASLQLPVSYHFSPGEQDDGVTVTVPQDALPQLQPSQLGWLVPGLVEEKIVALIRSLPKSIRRNLIPAPETARNVAGELAFGQGDFLQAVAKALSAIAEEAIDRDTFQLEKLAPHLHVNLRVVDDQGKVMAEGRDLPVLRQQLRVQHTTEIAHSPASTLQSDQWHRDGITAWEFGPLPKEVTLERGGIEIPAFPTLLDNGEDVRLRLVSCPTQAKRQSRGGIRRLYVLNQHKFLRGQVHWLPGLDEFSVLASTVVTKDALKQQLLELIADRAFLAYRDPTGKKNSLPRDASEFSERLTNSAERIGVATQDVAKVMPRLFRNYQAARLAAEQCQASRFQYARDDVQAQLNQLLADGFLLKTPWRWLIELPRYLQAVQYRLEKLSAGAESRDRQATADVSEFWTRYEHRLALHQSMGTYDPELDMFRWMLEEYRVSLFAQPVGTAFSISAQRLEKQWTKIS